MQPWKSSFGIPSALWTQRRETSLNWLALGLLLAAWNAVEDPDPVDAPRPAAAHGSASAISPEPTVVHGPAVVYGPAVALASAVAHGSNERRPASLRGYPCVTVRSMLRNVAAHR